MQASSKYSNLNSDYISLSSDDDPDEETSDGERFVRVLFYNFLLSFNPESRVTHIIQEIGWIIVINKHDHLKMQF